MTPERITKYYNAICEVEKIKPLPLKFTRVGKGGACLTYNALTLKPLYISIDLRVVDDVEYAVIHELTHQIKLLTEKNPYPGKKDQQKKFKKLENMLVEKYMYSKHTDLLWK